MAKADPQFVAEISDCAKQLKFAEGAIAMAEEQKRKLQHIIKERLREKGLRRIVGDGVSISWSPVKGREVIDIEALKAVAAASGIEIKQFIHIGEAGDRLTVTLKSRSAAA